MDSSLAAFLANAGVAGVVIILIIAGFLIPKPTHRRVLKDNARKDAEIAKLREALALERQRSNDTTQAGEVTIQLVRGLVKLASEHGDHHEDHDAAPDGSALPGYQAALDLGGKDLGL